MTNLQRFLKLNEGRKFKFALVEEEDGEVKDNKNIVACGECTFIERIGESYICDVFTIDPINFERNTVKVPMEFLNEGVIHMLF
jgi:hypothetical protein